MTDIKNRNKLTNWFRYRHNSTNCAQDNHHIFMSALSMLEVLTDTTIDELDSAKQWELMRNCIHSLSDEQVVSMLRRIKTLK